MRESEEGAGMQTIKAVADGDASGYWYPEHGDASSVDVLMLMRRYRAAETALRQRTRSSMGMGETDLLALRLLLEAERRGKSLRQGELAAALRMAPASVTALVDRLERSGHVRREPHPEDRRAVIIVPTTDTDDEVRATLGEMHRRMVDVVDAMAPDERDVVARFLTGMIAAVDAVDDHAQAAAAG